jgi:hypothetical protein
MSKNNSEFVYLALYQGSLKVSEMRDRMVHDFSDCSKGTFNNNNNNNNNNLHWCCNPVWVSRGFITVSFSTVGSLVPQPTPNPEGQGLHFVWTLPFDLPGMRGSTRNIRFCQHSSLSQWSVHECECYNKLFHCCLL